jgi:hypothetical protein
MVPFMGFEQAALAHIVRVHTSRIRARVPDARVELTGSASLGGLDALDIDLVVLSDDVPRDAKALARSYATLYPEQWDDDWAAFRDPGPPQVDLVVTRPGSTGDLHHRAAWELIASRQDLQDEYRTLKAYLAHGYPERKARFFDRVVAELG